METAVFGGGCFWCTEAVFQMLRGVSSVAPGYAGGTTPNPTDDDIYSGTSGHAEVVKIDFDPTQIAYRDLLTVFFGSHDPTSVNRQGADVGTQYRSVIFYTTEGQKKDAEDVIHEINESSKEGKPIVTEVVPLDHFYEAASYHKDFYKTRPESAYCQVVINPKLQKVQKQFADLLAR